MKSYVNTFHWLPRIFCILAILFVSMFAADSFSPELTIWQQIGAFLMHLIPSFVLILFLAVAWKWELIGGIILALTGIVMSPFIFNLNYYRNHFSVGQCIGILCVITLPFIVVGVLFIISHYMRKRQMLNTVQP